MARKPLRLSTGERPDKALQLKFKRLFPKTGDRLWAIREARGMTQKDVGLECGLSAGCISRLECGYTQGMGKTLAKIGYNMGLSVDYLLNLSDSSEIHNPSVLEAKDKKVFK